MKIGDVLLTLSCSRSPHIFLLIALVLLVSVVGTITTGGMQLTRIIVLALIQGAAELLPVSSSAHVILAEKLMGLDPTAPNMTFLLVMLHTGTMFAVLVYFWKRWASWARVGTARRMTTALVVATVCTGGFGLSAKFVIERLILGRLLQAPTAEIELLFGSLPLIAGALLVVGLLIIGAGISTLEHEYAPPKGHPSLSIPTAVAIGLVQGLALPFRGFSRSGATISTALLARVPRGLAEDFSFALVVLLTPPIIALELHRLLRSTPGDALHVSTAQLHDIDVGIIGMLFSFGAGLLALRWLSAWLENGRWHYFGYYCVLMAAVVAAAWRWGL